jgi:hypothetical protein
MSRRVSLTAKTQSQRCRLLFSAGDLWWDAAWLLHGLAQSLVFRGAEQAVDLADQAF